jgi:eukaryotic-like serine/threonine-protein kinase
VTLSIAPGTLVDGRYRIVSRVGSGGMADVYCADDIQLGRRVAVKLLHERFARDEEFVERFRREASSAASLSHANIVSVYDRGEWSGTYYIAMEYLDGRSLDSIVREEAPMAPEQAIEITEQVLRAARFAHRRGVVHRDLKPHNVILDEEGRVKVTDFGIARAGSSEITQTGSIMGTARYLSPEQAQGHAVGPRSDLYSIGVMLYELLTGTVPFEGDSVVAIALRHLSEPPRPPSSLVPAISPALDAIVLRALAKDPEQRFADADEFLMALEDERARLRGESGAHTAAIEPIVVMPPSAYPPPAHLHPATYQTQAIAPITGAHGETALAWWEGGTTTMLGGGVPPPRDRGPVWPWVLVAMLVIAGAAVALVLLLAKHHNSPPPPPAPTVPSVIGQNVTVAEANLGNDGYTPLPALLYSSAPDGQVVGQKPLGGTKLAKGSTVHLFVSEGPRPAASSQIPNIVGASAKSAEAALRTAGFKPSPAHQSSTTVPKGDVISTSPAVGATLKHGKTVVVFVSTGQPLEVVADVVGESFTEAVVLLKGFAVDEVHKHTSQAAPETVVAQSPKAGAKQPQGSTVTVTVAQAPANVTVPYLYGDSPAAAGAALSKLGLQPLQVNVIKHVNPDYDGLVIGQEPKVGSSVPPGTTVEIRVEQYVALGPTGPTGQSGASAPGGVTGASGSRGSSGSSGASGASGSSGATGTGATAATGAS